MSAPESTAVAVARAHVEAWGPTRFRFGANESRDRRARRRDDGRPDAAEGRYDGADVYMAGLIQFSQGVLPGTTEVTSAVGDDSHAMLHVTSRVKFGPDAPELTLYGSRLYLLDAKQKIKEEQVIFVVLPD
jgi:hypothetical protein